MTFEKGFLVGTASASYQVEGNNTKSDTWQMEHMKYGGYPEKSGDACDHYHTYRKDIEKMAEAGINSYRFSLEWSRIEPEEDQFDEAEMEHYIDMIHACKENGLEPVVTLFHFTSPSWLITKGGWESETTIEDFRKYTEYVCRHLKDEDLKYMCTINEANIGALIAGYIEKMQGNDSQGQLQIGMDLEKMAQEEKERKEECMRVFGVEEANVFTSPRSPKGMDIIFKAHKAAADTIHQLLPGVKCGLSLSLRDLQYTENGKEQRDQAWEKDFRMYLPVIKDDDFFGVQNYTRAIYDESGEAPVPEGAEITQMNYEYYPEGLEHVIREVHKDYKGELIVTENGIATENDERRCDYINTALQGVQSCINDAIPVKGYFYWSIMDNYEWQSGYSMQFGVMSCDRTTQEHKNKPSMYVLGGYANKG